MTPIFSRSWLVKIERGVRARHGAGQLAQGLAHQPGLDAHEAVAHLAFDLGPRHERGDRVDDDAVDAARADERLGDLERLLAGVGLADEQLVDVDAAGAGVAGIERVLDVDERDDAAAGLGLREDVLADGRLARRLRAEDLGDPAARDAADPERQVERDRARSGSCRATSFSRDPSFMIAPRPNCFSIVARAASTALPRSAAFRSAARSSVIAICPSRSSSDPLDRSPERTRMASAGRSAFLRCVVLDDRAFLARLADHLDVLRWLRQRREARLCWSSPSASSSLCSVDLASPSLASASSAAYRSILHADFSAPSLPLTRPARRRSSDIEAGKVPAWIAARILAMKSRVKVRL